MSEQFRTFRNIVIRAFVFIAVYVLAVMISSRLINQYAPDTAVQMTSSTFPLVYMRQNGINFNCLHGYNHEMDVSQMRYSITPLSEKREVTICIQTFGASVDSVSYEVVTIDGTQSLENTKVVRLEEDGDYITSMLTLGDGMYMNQEYVLKLQVTTGGRNIYYYTHVLLADGLHTADYLNFAAGFWDKCINKTDLDTVGAAVEPDDTTDTEGTLAHMDIHDSVKQLTWGDLNPQIYYKPTPRLTEINENTATMTLDYRISATAENGSTEVYNVHEYYRLRFTDSRVFLLNFERTTDQIFNPESNVVTADEGILLGVTGKSVEYMADEKARVVAFIQENVLWTYRRSSGIFTRVFGFPQQADMDERDFYKENSLRIMKVTSEGDVTFAVSGYMNRGSHEGDNGVGIYYFDAGSSLINELCFLRTTENTERVQMDTETCLYMTQDARTVYILLNGMLQRVDLTEGTVETVSSDVNNDCCRGSVSGRYFAWLKEGLMYGSGTIEFIDFETGQIREITGGENEYLRPLTFMKEDLVYGVAKGNDVAATHGGNGTFPMYRLNFMDGEGNTVKTYEPNGLYVVSVEQSDNLLNLKRVAWNGEIFADATPDQIVSTDTSDDVSLGMATKKDSRRQTVVLLRVGSSLADTTVTIGNSKMAAGRGSMVEMPQNPEPEDLFYVYASGGLDALCTYPNDAIVKADELFGVVVDHNQDYVWVRGDKDTEHEIELSDVPAVFTSGTLDTEKLEEGLGRKVVDLTGCTLDEVLYFVAHDKPVLVNTREGIKCIVGYDEYNTYLLNPGEEEWYYYGIQDSTDLFLASGNEFYSYTDSAA
ncbi:MAG: hypothetical protein IJ820_08610 [Lachnospiraceae bacterium]|nr:hypothetical protein [Lachnospiraceae bacterium]